MPTFQSLSHDNYGNWKLECLMQSLENLFDQWFVLNSQCENDKKIDKLINNGINVQVYSNENIKSKKQMKICICFSFFFELNTAISIFQKLEKILQKS